VPIDVIQVPVDIDSIDHHHRIMKEEEEDDEEL